MELSIRASGRLPGVFLFILASLFIDKKEKLKMPKMNMLDKARMYLVSQKGKPVGRMNELVISRGPGIARHTVANLYPNPDMAQWEASEYYGPYLQAQEKVMRTLKPFGARRQIYFRPYSEEDMVPLHSVDMEPGFSLDEVVERRSMRGLDEDGISWY
jgi:hypothetical protein